MKMGMTFAVALAFLTACGEEQGKTEPAAPVAEQASTPVTTPPAQTEAPATPTAPAPTTTTPSTPTTPTTPAPTTAALDCSNMQAVLQAMASGGDPQQIAQQCMGSLGGGAGGLPNLPGLPTGGNTP